MVPFFIDLPATSFGALPFFCMSASLRVVHDVLDPDITRPRSWGRACRGVSTRDFRALRVMGIRRRRHLIRRDNASGGQVEVGRILIGIERRAVSGIAKPDV